LVFICTPGNPTGTVLDHAILVQLLDLADKHDFIIASDECYSEIYLDEDHPPTGLLQAAAEVGRNDYHRCLVFHSLSKRSNVPGLRSGFVAGDQALIESFFKYRTFHGCAMPGFIQAASIAAWQDENHVELNRKLYREKFTGVLEILAPVMNVQCPEAGFYLWPEVPISDQTFTQQLFSKHNVTVLPGSFLSRTANGINPGDNRIRIALVAPLEECVEAAARMRDQIHTQSTGN
jgi:N-succinyldiaminopimelate aminotransferase